MKESISLGGRGGGEVAVAVDRYALKNTLLILTWNVLNLYFVGLGFKVTF